jgi:hypothetical protein
VDVESGALRKTVDCQGNALITLSNLLKADVIEVADKHAAIQSELDALPSHLQIPFQERF